MSMILWDFILCPKLTSSRIMLTTRLSYTLVNRRQFLRPLQMNSEGITLLEDVPLPQQTERGAFDFQELNVYNLQ